MLKNLDSFREYWNTDRGGLGSAQDGGLRTSIRLENTETW